MEENFLKKAEDFCAKYKMAETTFGRKAAGNAHFLARIRGGKSFLISTANKVQEFMKNYDEYESTKK
ncbi:hypothetical protein FAI40_01755 [Acetobacteraceae bacterium]|nr:hypothetical protein FAI40_01755 [Acetobacteraceae bacterium]